MTDREKTTKTQELLLNLLHAQLVAEGPGQVSVAMTAVANTKTPVAVVQVRRSITVTGIRVLFEVVPMSASGRVTMAVYKYDPVTATDYNLLSTDMVDLETLIDNTVSDLTLATALSDLSLSDGDIIHACIISDNGDMMGGTGGVLTVKFTKEGRGT